MHSFRNRLTSDSMFVIFLTLLLCLCSVENARTETDSGTETSVSLRDVSASSTLTLIQPFSTPVTPGSTATEVSTTKSIESKFSTISQVPSSSTASGLSNTQTPQSSTTTELSTTETPQSSTTAELSKTQALQSSTTAELSNNRVPSTSTTADLSSTEVPTSTTSSERHPNTQLTTPSQTTVSSFSNGLQETQLAPTTASSLDLEDASSAVNTSAVPRERDNVTEETFTTDTTDGLSPTTTLGNKSNNVIVGNQTNVFPLLDNAIDSSINDTNTTSFVDLDPQEQATTSLMTQLPNVITTVELSADMDTSKVPETSSSTSSSFYSSSSSSQSSLSSAEPDHPPQPQSQPQEMTFAAKVALGFGVMVGISCVIVVAIVSVHQVLGYWARRDYSNLEQNNIMFS